MVPAELGEMSGASFQQFLPHALFTFLAVQTRGPLSECVILARQVGLGNARQGVLGPELKLLRHIASFLRPNAIHAVLLQAIHRDLAAPLALDPPVVLRAPRQNRGQ
eukprot:CAMPEP_0198494608 /NCGR_PEP_ID=MMETSP1462-20131121/4723_1 /TAXON_ID=1333877 /ORGANISM="Brandtodinium nutriculum, Strain RCC3387" /LENGTH=106 /DNA_ID=CAMNT_0044223347 /DNA_START=245 /DNA_END=562 /DNA_ORIENTATION=+